jgi:PAS domain S-box-containing protein
LIALALCSVVFQFLAAYLSFRFVYLRRLGRPWILVSVALLIVGGMRVYSISEYSRDEFPASFDSTIDLIEFACSFLLGIGFVLTERWYLLKERLEGRFRLIADVDRALIGVLDEEKILSAVCDGLVREKGYRLAWIGIAEPDGSVSVGKCAGEGQEFLGKVWLRWDDTDEGGCPPGVAVRNGEVCVVNRVLDDPRTRLWMNAAWKYGIRSFVSAPIDVGRSSPMVLSIGGAREGIFDRLEVEAIGAMASRMGNALVSARKHELFVSARTSYGELFQSQRDGVILVRGGVIVRVNPTGVRMLGYSSSEELQGMDPSQFIPGSEDSSGLSHLFRPGAEERESVVIAKMRRKDGSLFEGEIAATWAARSGRNEYWDQVMTGPLGMLIFRDVTHRTRTLEELQKERDFSAKVLDVAAMLVVQMETRGEILLFNRQCEEVTGYPAAEAIGRKMTDFLLPESGKDTHLRAIREIIAGRIPPSLECVLLTRSGEERMVVWNYASIPGPDGKVGSILAAGTDITERRRLEQAVITMQKMEAVGTLAGGVAHDFNNILTGILGNLDLTRRLLPPGSSAVATIDESITASERAACLIRQLLEFSRRTPLERRATDMRKLADEVVHLFAQTIDKRIEVSMTADADLWLAKVDSSQVHQVLMNLCVNARDAIAEQLENGRAGSREKHRKWIRVGAENVTVGSEYCRAYPYARPGEFVVLSIADNGVGMDEATKRRVFEPFFTTKSLGRGTGLGLSTAYGIIKQHEGWITLESEPGSGTTFRCYFPRSTDRPNETEATQEAMRSPQGKETILLVDDEEMIRNLGSLILEKQGYKVILARDGQEGIDMFLARQKEIDLVLLDLTMPHMTGLEVLERIRAVDPLVKVVLSSGYRGGEEDGSDRFSEASAFLSKPYRADSLVRIVRDVLDGTSS